MSSRKCWAVWASRLPPRCRASAGPASAACGCAGNGPVPSAQRSAAASTACSRMPTRPARPRRQASSSCRRRASPRRAKVVEIVKTLAEANAAEWGRIELEETKIGRLDHKIEKLQDHQAGARASSGCIPMACSGDHGITLEEYTPFGVVGAITPSTHSIPTLSGNIINMVAAGNAVVFNAHPAAAKCAAMAVRVYNEAIERELGIENLVTIIEQPTLESFKAICKHEAVRLLCVTGGPGVVKAAMQTGKRAICAGPGNPPVLVDDTACMKRAAKSHHPGRGLRQQPALHRREGSVRAGHVADKFMAADGEGRRRPAERRPARAADQGSVHLQRGPGRRLRRTGRQQGAHRQRRRRAGQGRRRQRARQDRSCSSPRRTRTTVREGGADDALPPDRAGQDASRKASRPHWSPSTITSTPPSSTRTTSST